MKNTVRPDRRRRALDRSVLKSGSGRSALRMTPSRTTQRTGLEDGLSSTSQKPCAVLAFGRSKPDSALLVECAAHWLLDSSSKQPEVFFAQNPHVMRHFAQRNVLALQEGGTAPGGSSGSA